MEPVTFRDCACPGTPHPDGDTVTFRPKLPFEASIEALQLMFKDGPGKAQSGNAWPVYLRHGPVAWNLVDAEGDPLPLDPETLDFADQYEIADRADDLYGESVLAPLVRRTRKLSASTRTRAGSPQRPRRSSTRRS